MLGFGRRIERNVFAVDVLLCGFQAKLQTCNTLTRALYQPATATA
jgi:hypothetical protein